MTTNDNGDGVRQLNHSQPRIDDPYFINGSRGFCFLRRDGRLMIGVLLVGVGSFVGGVLRYGLSTWVYKALDNPWFPYGTLTVNAAGCLVIGFLSGLAEARAAFTPEARLFLFVGVIGGFTTFSSFALETFSLARDTQSLAALVNIGLQLCLGLFAVWIGNVMAHALGG
jgi:fluoride exporter